LKISLALGGGAGLGWAHIGVLRTLDEAGVEVGAISGTSIGAILAACYAGDKLDIVEELARTTNFKTYLRYIDPHWKRGGFIGGNAIEKLLREYLGEITFEELSVPTSMIAADLYTGETVIMDKGDVVNAVRASMSLPGIMKPVLLDGRLLVDGGAAIPVPVGPARALAPDLPCVAISLQNDYVNRAKNSGIDRSHKRAPNSISVVKASVALSLQNLARYALDLDPPEVELALPVGHIDLQNFTRADELIDIGRAETEAALPKIREFTEQAR